VRYSRAIIDLFRETEDAMGHHKGISGGKLKVAVISAGDYFFPQLLAEFARHNQGVSLDLTVHNREELLERPGENLTDLAVMVRPPRDMDTVNEIFAPHPYVIVAAPSHPLAALKRISMSALAREPFVTGTRVGHLEFDARDLRAAAQEVENRHGDQEHRNHQTGGDRRHGRELSVGSHDQPGAGDAQVGGCSTWSVSRGHSSLVCRPPPQQASCPP